MTAATANLQLLDRRAAFNTPTLLTLVPCIHSSHLSLFKVAVNSQKWAKKDTSMRCNKRFTPTTTTTTTTTTTRYVVTRCSGSSHSNDKSCAQSKAPFGYSRKDGLLIGLGVTLFGVALKSGLEYAGVDPLQAGNVVQLLVVLGMTVGWISTYMFRVASKDMTYAQQLRDYENKVMEKRLEGLTEAELQVLLEQVEEEKRGVVNGEQVN